MVTKSFPPRRVTLSTLRSERGVGTRIPKNRTSCLQVSRCRVCDSVYNLYSGTVFAQKQYRPAQVVLLLQGFSSSQLARELGISRQTVLTIRQVLQGSAQILQPEGALPDTETDEVFQNAVKKENRIKTQRIHRVGVGINTKVMALMKITVPYCRHAGA